LFQVGRPAAILAVFVIEAVPKRIAAATCQGVTGLQLRRSGIVLVKCYSEDEYGRPELLNMQSDGSAGAIRGCQLTLLTAVIWNRYSKRNEARDLISSVMRYKRAAKTQAVADSTITVITVECQERKVVELPPNMLRCCFMSFLAMKKVRKQLSRIEAAMKSKK
jgi:hypothetical protein